MGRVHRALRISKLAESPIFKPSLRSSAFDKGKYHTRSFHGMRLRRSTDSPLHWTSTAWLVTFGMPIPANILHCFGRMRIVEGTASGRSTVKAERTQRARFLPHEEIPVPLPILSESLSLVELVALRLSPVYYGSGVPAGDGTAVVIVPGFLGIDLVLFELHAWLARIGYRPYFSGMGLAAECPDVLAQNLSSTIDKAYLETGRKVHLIGHSLGGIFARSAAVRMPNRIKSVTTLGSPFRGLVVHAFVLMLANLVRRRIRTRTPKPQGCATSRCSCDFARSLRNNWPRSVAQTAIYTRDDGIVDWRYCVTGDPGVDVEVGGTHVGLIFNSTTYVRIAERLAEPRVHGRRKHTAK